MAAYYNEINPYCAQWLRNLIAAGHIAPGEVDERDIRDVGADDLRGFEQCHFFSGIGGWSYALRLAGWADDRPVWTGSCPCPPFSSAARGRTRRTHDARHLWPAWRALVAECMPSTLFGEQVAAAGDWMDVLCDDVARLGYSIGAAVLPACGVGYDHVRHRIYFACDTNGEGKSDGAEHEEMAGLPRHFAGKLGRSHGLSARMGKLRAYGNAIVPQVAAQFIRAYMEC
jgi:DNA (cytosine-5)-methyltransferase 1